MAEPTRSPSLPSTADTTPYVPVSWMAVAAVTVAGLFALLLLAFGSAAFTNKKPLLMPELLALPVIAIVLSFAALRMIRNSEGTRTGEKLASAAWWLALVLGLCYVAYLLAIGYSVRRDARGEVEKWMENVAQGTPRDIRVAFTRTLPPGMRQNVSADDEYQMERQFRDELLMFRNCDLVRLAQRNQGSFTYTAGAVEWAYKPGAVECSVTGTAKCPEGTFPVLIQLKGLEGVTGEGGAGRQWMITRPPSGGFIDQRGATRTPYGWLVASLEMDGGAFGRGFVSHLATGPTSHAYAYRAFVVPGSDRRGWGAVATDPMSQFIFAVPSRALGDEGYADYMANHFYKLPGGAEPSGDKKAEFFKSWNAQGVRPAGEKLKGADGNPIDKEDVISITPTAVEVRVPVEIPLPGTSGKFEVARGRIVVTTTAPVILDMLKRYKDSANPEHGTASAPGELEVELKQHLKDPTNPIGWSIPWRVVRIESDMAPVNVAPRGPGGPGGPGMPPGMPGGPGAH
jgi:hypothetical protein